MNNIKTQCVILLLLILVFSGESRSDGGLTTQFKANIINNSCRITVTGNGQIHLGVVLTRALTTLTPAQYGPGTLFSIMVNECGQSSSRDATQLHFAFRPQSGVFPSQSQQAFINEQSAASGGAENIGIAVFDALSQKNVLNTDGTSNITVKATSSLGVYNFSARIQPLGKEVSPGFVLSNVLVDVYYD
jgi:type 1 fimbria pilin